MKKLIVLIASITFVFAAGTAFAGAGSITDAGTQIGGADFACSTKVTLTYNTTATSYGAATKHESGNKGYTTTSVATGIDEEDSAVGTVSITAPAAP